MKGFVTFSYLLFFVYVKSLSLKFVRVSLTGGHFHPGYFTHKSIFRDIFFLSFARFNCECHERVNLLQCNKMKLTKSYVHHD